VKEILERQPTLEDPVSPIHFGSSAHCLRVGYYRRVTMSSRPGIGGT